MFIGILDFSLDYMLVSVVAIVNGMLFPDILFFSIQTIYEHCRELGKLQKGMKKRKQACPTMRNKLPSTC